MIDEYAVGLKENPEDTSTSKRLHRNKIRSTGSTGKGLDPNVIMPLLGLRTQESAGVSRLKAPSEGVGWG